VKPLDIRRLGVVPYEEALGLQRALVEDRRAGRIDDLLLLVEHPDVLTVGVRAGGHTNILASHSTLEAQGIRVYEAGRGGDVTYHGPGQVIGYPILDLRPDRQDVHKYMRDLEEVLIRAVADFDIVATRLPGFTGVWVGDEKLAAIGVRVSRWITSHGFALNVGPELAGFGLIIPCGIGDRGVTSLARLGCQATRAEVEERVAVRFCEVFERTASPRVLAFGAG
jgi:lipoyl(octanoyl) transferase